MTRSIIVLLLSMLLVAPVGCVKVTQQDYEVAHEFAQEAIADLYVYKSYKYVYDRAFHPDLQATTSIEELEQFVLESESLGPLEKIITESMQPSTQGMSVTLILQFKDTDVESRMLVLLEGSAKKGYKITGFARGAVD